MRSQMLVKRMQSLHEMHHVLFDGQYSAAAKVYFILFILLSHVSKYSQKFFCCMLTSQRKDSKTGRSRLQLNSP